MKNHSQTRAELLEKLSGLLWRVAELQKSHDKGNGKKVSPAVARVDRTGLVDQKKATTGHVQGNEYPPSGESKVQEAIQETEAQLRIAFEDGTVPMATLNPDLQLVQVNRAFCDLLGYTKQELKGRIIKDISHPDDVEQSVSLTTRVFKSGLPSFQCESRFFTKSQTIIWSNVVATVVRDSEGKPTHLFVTIENITERKRAEDLQNLQRLALEKVAVGTNQSDVLNELCSQVKTMLSPCTCTVMLLDKQTGCLNVAAPADLPEGLSSALDGLVPGEFAGSWGTAVYTRKPVIVTDTETDPRWADLRDFAREFGIRACWSIPLFSTGNQIVGAFAISHPQPRDATSFDLQILETISYVAGIAIERRRSEEVLQARAHQQALVTELGQSALTGLDLPILMHVAVSLIAQTLEVEYCKVLELLPDGEEMILRAGFGYPADAVNHVTVGEGLDSQAAYTLVSEKPVVVEDLRTETRFSGTPLLHQLGVRSGMSVIISGKPHHFGVLGIHSTQLRTFTSDDIHFVQAVANVLALAIERKRMEETLRISEQAIRELYEITSAPETSFESRVRALLELGCQRFNLPIGLVTRREGDHFEMKFIRTGEMIEDFVSESRRIHICNLYCGAALEAEEPICFGHASKSDWSAHPGFYTTGLEAYLGTKIVVSGDKYGTLFFAGFEPYRGTFTEGDKDFLQLIARWIGGEIERQEAEEELKRQRSFLRQVIDSNPNFVFAKNREGRFTLVNQAVADVYGTTVEDLLGKTESDFSSDVEEVEAFQRIDLEVMDSKQERFMAEETITDAAGQIHWLQTVKRPLSNDEGVADQVLSVATDITARKQAEEALVKSELRFRLVARATYDAIWDWDVVRNSLEWNDGTQSLFGHEPDAVGPDLAWWIEHIHPEDRTRVVNKVHAVIESGASVWSSEYQFRCYDGTYAMVMDRGYVVYDETGQAIRMVGAMNDITERKQAEEALRESEEHLRFVTDHSPVGIVHCDQAQRYKFVNRHFAEMFGLQASDIVGMSARELLGEDVYAYYVSPYLKAVQAGQHLEYDLMLPATSHGKRTVHIRCVPERDASGQVAGYIASLTDITERKQAEAKLKASEERYAMVMGAVNEGIWDWEIATKQVYLSSTWKKILGYADDEVQNVYEEWTSRIHPEDYDRVMASLKKHFDWNQPYEVEYRLRHKDGTYQWILTRGACVRDEQGRPYRMFGSITDITQRKNAEDQVRHAEVQLRHSQKMNALGTLAGGIAHDFNNILAALMGYTELIHTKGPYEKTVQGYLTEVLKAGSRAKELVQQILTFSCQTEGEKKPLHLQQVVQEVLMLIRATLPSTIEIQVDLSASSDLVEADATQIHQVLMNLCTNAEYAMRDQGGVLSLRLETEEEVAADSPAPHLVLIPGPHLLLTVQDTGYGMSSEVLDRVFDPFFTTKGPGEGTGMGLAVVHGIIADHHGRITVTSTPGEGTTVSIVFPLLAAAATAATAIDTIETDAEHSSAAPLKPGNGHVLFVDDEVPLVELGKEVLEEFGYEVTTRTSSLEALEAFRAAPGRYDVLITDQTMPNLSGEALAREILRIRPDIPILLFTGFSHTITADKARELGIRKFLMKPLLRNDLLLAIQEVLDEVDTKD